jgi:purine nucleosidase
VQGCGAIGQYLHHLFTHNPLWSIVGDQSHKPYSWVIWDVINIAWMLNPNWVPSELVRTPILLADKRWQADPSRHLMREAYAVQRDAIFQDFFVKLASA